MIFPLALNSKKCQKQTMWNKWRSPFFGNHKLITLFSVLNFFLFTFQNFALWQANVHWSDLIRACLDVNELNECVFRWQWCLIFHRCDGLWKKFALCWECNVGNKERETSGQYFWVDVWAIECTWMWDSNFGQRWNWRNISTWTLSLANSGETFFIEQTDDIVTTAGFLRLFSPAHLTKSKVQV